MKHKLRLLGAEQRPERGQIADIEHLMGDSPLESELDEHRRLGGNVARDAADSGPKFEQPACEPTALKSGVPGYEHAPVPEHVPERTSAARAHQVLHSAWPLCHI